MANHVIDNALDGVADLYSAGVKEHGLSSKSVGWKDPGQQLLRFDKLTEVIDGSEGAFTVNDLGCGYGAMFTYLDSRYGRQITGFRGYDICQDMLTAAAAHVRDPRAAFMESGMLGKEADYSFVSGTFNVRMQADEAHWQSFIEDSIRNLAECSRLGFAFNLLSTYVDWKEDHLYYGDPLYFFDFCKRNVSRNVSLLHDYPLYEWTIYVRF